MWSFYSSTFVEFDYPIAFIRLLLDPVHTYPDIFESATFSFRIRLSSTRIRRIRKQIRKFLNPLSRVEIFESDNIVADSKISGYVWTDLSK